ncbi:unnamed protein product [Didymodactylos carnosus]|uniref:Uncharacterized protein n=1 Tax=Didymodactylos carnosus TaxID=1234261 RepID=A0A813XSA7_9BILA|nr:unnamed protein product [Didymodactylos carnosus]CAF3662481.1 unnamed protein product [Didymodactylos carnosus]
MSESTFISDTKPKNIIPNRNKLKSEDKTSNNNNGDQDLSTSSTSEDSHTLLSETVTTLASSVYNELERIIKKYGENSVKDLMPVMIATLESLDSALHDKEVRQLENESLKEQTDQLYQQYEREKQFHKEYQQRYLQVEDNLEETKRENDEKLQSLESIVKIFEIKARNAADHVSRLEEKESEMKQEYKRLHDRYCELFKAHCDYMERTKILYGTDKLDQLSSNALRVRSNMHLPVQQHQFDSKAPFSHTVTNDRTPTRADVSFTSYNGPVVGASFRSELESSHGTHTQTDTLSRNDAAVNTDFEKNYFHPEIDSDVQASDEDDDLSIDDNNKNMEAFYKETRNENIDISDVDASADLLGMTKEVANLIKENNELLETKNALNVLKDDLLVKIEELSSEQEILREEVTSLQTVKTRLQLRITELEEEVKKSREELDKRKKEEEEDVPTGDRKRFTKVEMSRILLERNSYKQRLMELEEAIHWQDHLRASKLTDPQSAATSSTLDNAQQKKRSTFWKLASSSIKAIVPQNILGVPMNDIKNDLREGTTQISDFFSGLFGATPAPPEKPSKRSLTAGSGGVKYSHTSDQLAPNPNTNSTSLQNDSENNLPLERTHSNSENLVTESTPKMNQNDKTSSPVKQRKNSLIAKDDSRVQAYGWSLPSKNQLKLSELNGKVHVNVPVPVYCRPIYNTNDLTQIWCAVGIDLNGAPTSNNLTTNSNDADLSSLPSGEQLNKQLIESYNQMTDEPYLRLSSLVWIASKCNQSAMITIIDSNKADKIIDTFTLGRAVVYAMGSVPGPASSDYTVDDEQWKRKSQTVDHIEEKLTSNGKEYGLILSIYNKKWGRFLLAIKVVSCAAGNSNVIKANEANTSVSETFPLEIKSSEEAVAQLVLNTQNTNKKPMYSTKYPTVWLGSGDGWLYLHSSVGDYRTTIEKVWLKNAIYSVVHVRGRVFVALANEKIAVFRRNNDGTWNLKNFYLIEIGKSRQSVRCLINVFNNIWCGVMNRIHVIDSQSLEIIKQFDVHPHLEHSVQHMTWSGEGVWISVRLSSTLQLYHAINYQHLQDVDVQPYVEKMIATEKAGLYFVHISSLSIACKRLWIGTGNGIIISVPLSENSSSSSNQKSSALTKPGSVIRVYDQSSSNIPYCSMNNAQLSFHGYKDAVKFFVVVSGNPPPKLSIENKSNNSELNTIPLNSDHSLTISSDISFSNDMLVLSGGEGYIDFRVGDVDNINEENKQPSTVGKSHLIVWHVSSI